MKFNFIKEDEKEVWNEFVIQNNGSFLQSSEWGEFQKEFLRKVWRIEINKDDRKILGAEVIKEKIFFITYFYIPYGPVFNKYSFPEERQESFNLFLKEIARLAKKEKALFLRIEPITPLPEIENFYFRNSLKRIQPQRTLILNLEKSESELLAEMHKKTRYNIGLAQRKGVEIKIIDDYSDIFYRLLEKTRERQGFSSYSQEHYKKIFKVNSKNFKARIFLAEYQKKIIAANIVIFFGKQATYLHGASDFKQRNLMAPHFLHWQQILEAKTKGFGEYDFWGIDEKKFPGVTNFKRGFRGEEIEYPPGIDIVFNNILYQIYRIMKIIKQIF